MSVVHVAVGDCHQRRFIKTHPFGKNPLWHKAYKMTLWLWLVILIMTSGMSRQDIERHFERALPFLVGCLSVLVALLLPLVISTYIQISSKGKFLGYTQPKLGSVYIFWCQAVVRQSSGSPLAVFLFWWHFYYLLSSQPTALGVYLSLLFPSQTIWPVRKFVKFHDHSFGIGFWI